MDAKQVDVMVADASHEVYVDKILDTIREAAKVRGTGIAERTHEYVTTKMKEGKAIIALCGEDFAGFTYIESWGNKQYVATSGLIVHPNYRGMGLAKRIKAASFRLARLRWPKAKIFSLTSGAAVMKMNTELGYVPVTFNELTDDDILVLAGADRSQNHRIKLDYLQVTSGVGVRSVASLGLNIAGEKFEACASGNGPVDAAIKALKKIVERHMTLKEFTIQAISKGSDDVGKVHMQVEYDNQIYYGFGANTDIIAASVEAYIDCINKFKS